MALPKKELQAEALRLRVDERKGTNEIAKILGVSKGSVSSWLKDHPLTDGEVKLRWFRGGRPSEAKETPPSKFYSAICVDTLSNQRKAKIAESAVMFRLVLHGFDPFGSVFDGDKADWLVEVPETRRTLRVQVRWARQEEVGRPLVPLRCGDGRGKSRPFRKGDFDFIVGYDLYDDTCYVWSWDEVQHLTSAISVCQEAAERWDKLHGL